MTFPIAGMRTTFSAVVAAILNNTQHAVATLTPDQVWTRRENAIVLSPQPNFIGEQQVILSGGPITPPFETTGEGRVSSYIYRRVTFTIRTDSNLDEANKDDVRLMDPNLGHWMLEDAIFAASQLWDVVDANGNQLIKEPMRLVGGTEAGMDTQKNPGWTVSKMHFEVAYLPNLTFTPTFS